MIKPKKTRRSAVDYFQAAAFIEDKLGYKLRDTLDSKTHFIKWCKAHKIKPDGSSQEQWKQYEEAPDGNKLRPEYRDYWHFLGDRCDIHNGGAMWIYRELLEDSKPWQAEITQAFIDEFGDGCMFWTEW